MLLFLLPITATTVTGAAATLAAWGCAFWSMNPPLNTWLVRLAPTQTNLLMPLLGSAIYLGMGLGSLFGGATMALLGLGPLPPIAGVLSAAAVAILLTRAARTSRVGTNVDIGQDAPSPSSVRDRTMT
jgi:predicted MFS family arabinose efflux permease